VRSSKRWRRSGDLDVIFTGRNGMFSAVPT